MSGLAIDGVTLTPVASFTSDYQSLIGQLDAAGVDLVVGNIPDLTSIPYVSTLPYFLVDATGTPVLVNGQLVPLIGETTTGDRPLTAANALPADYSFNGVEYGGYRFDGLFLSGGLFSYDGVHPTALGYAITANAFIEAINATYGAHIPPVDLLPFVYDGIGNNGSVVPPSQAAGAIFTIEARGQVVSSLGMPPVVALSRMGPVDREAPAPGRVAPRATTRTGSVTRQPGSR